MESDLRAGGGSPLSSGGQPDPSLPGAPTQLVRESGLLVAHGCPFWSRGLTYTAFTIGPWFSNLLPWGTGWQPGFGAQGLVSPACTPLRTLLVDSHVPSGWRRTALGHSP